MRCCRLFVHRTFCLTGTLLTFSPRLGQKSTATKPSPPSPRPTYYIKLPRRPLPPVTALVGHRPHPTLWIKKLSPTPSQTTSSACFSLLFFHTCQRSLSPEDCRSWVSRASLFPCDVDDRRLLLLVVVAQLPDRLFPRVAPEYVAEFRRFLCSVWCRVSIIFTHTFVYFMG